MKKFYFPLSIAFSLCTLFGLFTETAKAQTASINITQTTPASCSGGGAVTAMVSVPAACSINGYLPCVNASLTGPG
ncbi:MAG: hypothetical protein ACI9FU_001062 [Granulosicoccus sp.]|jgi:hypothetical protein